MDAERNGGFAGAESAGGGGQLGGLAAELRNAVTAVAGYLELILDGTAEAPPETHLHWVGVIERRLESVEDLSRDMRALCLQLRDPGAPSPPPG